MTETTYGIKKATRSLPERSMLVVPHGGKNLQISYPAFGPNWYKSNVAEMGKKYSHSSERPEISFREPTTSESIAAVAHGFGSKGDVDAKRDIFNPRWLQLGRIVRTSEGVFANPPRDAQGNTVTDAQRLTTLLNGVTKVNGIYLAPNDFGFAPYDAFTRGVQDCDTFAKGGLARILEHTSSKMAKHLHVIASPENYKKGVHVLGFDSVTTSVVMVASLGSDRDFDDDRLVVGGGSWVGDYGGFAFGVLESGEASAPKK